MNSRKHVIQALNVRQGFTGDDRKLLLLYADGTYEYIFHYDRHSAIINVLNFNNKTRAQIIARLEVEYYNDKIKGEFLDM